MGSTRSIEFCLKSKNSSDPVLTQELSEGSLLTMAVRCQQALKHWIPRTKTKVGPRYSISFRKCVSSSTNKATMKSVEQVLESPVVPLDVDLIPGFLDAEESNCLLNDIKSLNFTKIGNREVSYAGEHEYKYSGFTHSAKEIPVYIKEIMVKLPCDETTKMNSVIITKYRDGNAFIPEHSDDKKEICPNSKIYNISLGQSRKMKVISILDRSIEHEYVLEHGSLNVMSRAMQDQ